VNAILPVTQFALPDEKAYWLYESGRFKHGVGMRMVQRIIVVRDGRLAAYEEDIGEWDWKKNRTFQSVGLFEYSVAELREHAEMARNGKEPEPMYEPINLLEAWDRDIDRNRKARLHQSIIGSSYWRQRS
jgi:hypothetical protein